MTDLSTEYLGLTLHHPIMVASSRLTRDLEGVQAVADAGASAIVLTSIYEEEILQRVDALVDESHSPFWHPEAMDYITRFGAEDAVGRYLDFIDKVKNKVSVPALASVHCTSAEGWIDFAQRVEAAGADALELNLHVLPSDPELKNRDYESVYYDVLTEVRKLISIPIALKLGFFFSGLARTYRNLSRKGADSLVLFNRYYGLDFDIETMSLKPPGFLFRTADLSLRLRWISIMANQVECNLAASGGIYEGEDVIKLILAGASAVEICSTLFKNGLGYLSEMLEIMEKWMERHGFNSIDEFRGKLSQSESEDPAAYERIQFLKGSECDC
jgi:dihydroorotate dehydrogenase (fumarate)